ncbi:glycosyltransferase [Trichocoleus sp. FACHB-90]|uniref:glycosyltransferase n=1 Tax=Cyanophyceae TaxID=3028117 RepID=UPI001682A493|nr:glycosyltransferase [Trichocoleus sp. FACHB-90]MBD1925828.1 glycosyltransferase [Trichocoleus sp. FACHB-90]
MRILIALPTEHPELPAIDSVINGTASCSGTTGSIIRLAAFLTEAGLDVCLSSACESKSTIFTCIKHQFVKTNQFDCLVVHQSHWDGTSLTFGNQNLGKTFLWFQNQTSWAFVHNFLRKGGNRIIVPSIYHANIYRAVPQWRDKVTVIYNSYCPIFTPVVTPTQPRLLFIGAITPNKGVIQLMEIWSYLVQKQVNLKLAIAGSISIHKGSRGELGSLQIAENNFETNQIKPWLTSLPQYYQPYFLGALSPVQLRTEIAQSWAVIVNPSWEHAETFCVSAVDAQACDRTVFSVAVGGLKETVYQGNFNSLTKERSVEAFGQQIIAGLSHPDAVKENGLLAGNFVRNKFSYQSIRNAWIQVLSGQKTKPTISPHWNSSRDLLCDLMRWSRTGMLINQYIRS